MLQDIAPHKFFNRFYDKSAKPESKLLYIKDGRVLVKRSNTAGSSPSYELLTASDLKEINGRRIYLFSLDENEFFLLRTDADVPLKYVQGDMLHVRDIQRKALLPKYLIFAVLTASHLALRDRKSVV